jgi:hypothetical protein
MLENTPKEYLTCLRNVFLEDMSPRDSMAEKEQQVRTMPGLSNSWQVIGERKKKVNEKNMFVERDDFGGDQSCASVQDETATA